MIRITVDEKACVGCSLCVDYCQTGVFTFDETECVPRVDKPEECFGCLGCSELCPSTAIEHEGVVMSESFCHDPYALKLARRTAGDGWKGPSVPDGRERWQEALTDLGVRLLSVAAVFRQTLGTGLPAVGTLAGRTLAGQLPRYGRCRGFQEALDLARKQFAPAWEIETAMEGTDRLTVNVKGCFIRDLCRHEGLPLGGELCTLFFYYLAGYVGKSGGARLRLAGAERGESGCVYRVTIHPETAR